MKVQVSDPVRTIVDILNDPLICGGIRHVADIIKEFLFGDSRDDKKLADYIKKIHNRTIYKRLGYILEAYKINAPDLIKVCIDNISEGFTLLDPGVADKGSYLRRWNLRINVNIS